VKHFHGMTAGPSVLCGNNVGLVIECVSPHCTFRADQPAYLSPAIFQTHLAEKAIVIQELNWLDKMCSTSEEPNLDHERRPPTVRLPTGIRSKFPMCSVVSAQADVFTKILSKIGKILRIFDKLDEIKSRWVLCQS
jgi:hypothetical protein